MEYYKKPFNNSNTFGLPSVTKEYLLSIGVEETSVGYYDEPENGMYDIPIEAHPIATILSHNYDCVVPVWKKDNDTGGYLLVRKGKDCMIIYRDGERCANIMESFVTIIPPINSNEFVVQRKDGKWGVVAPHKEKALVEFGKYKYLWGFDAGLCMFEVDTNHKQTFSNRGIINSIGIEVVKPYTYTNIFDFYGKGTSHIKVEKEDREIYLEKSALSQTVIKENRTSEMDYREDIKKCYSSIMEQEKTAVNMELSLGFSVNLRTIYQTLDVLKIMMAYAWEKHRYGSYRDFFHGKEMESKYLGIKQYPHESIVNDFKKYLKQFHVRTIFDDDVNALEKMEEIISSLEKVWTVTNSRLFAPEEIAAVDRAKIVASKYGNSVCFFFKSGRQTYIPLDEQSKLSVGDELDLKTAKIITLSRKGNEDIYRVIE
ncbi:MAG: hypothetical protein IKH59_07315 [Bacteroidaceae bacterium]|nr:hypothetical protein [Bacteroidaceae bacterium]